jgi:hypothetical protein
MAARSWLVEVREMQNTFWLLGAIGWLLVGTWLVAPFLALAIAFILMVGIRGYGQAMVLSLLIAGVARWVFFLAAGSCAYYKVWSGTAVNLPHLLRCIGSSLLMFASIFCLILVLWIKAFWIWVPDEPLWWLSLDIIGEFDGLGVLMNTIGVFVVWWENQQSLSTLFHAYFVVKLFVFFYAIKLLFWKVDKNTDRDQLRMLSWLIAMLLWLCSLIGLPPVAEERIVIYTYEIGWWLAVIPISWGCLALVRGDTISSQ